MAPKPRALSSFICGLGKIRLQSRSAAPCLILINSGLICSTSEEYRGEGGQPQVLVANWSVESSLVVLSTSITHYYWKLYGSGVKRPALEFVNPVVMQISVITRNAYRRLESFRRIICQMRLKFKRKNFVKVYRNSRWSLVSVGLGRAAEHIS